MSSSLQGIFSDIVSVLEDPMDSSASQSQDTFELPMASQCQESIKISMDTFLGHDPPMATSEVMIHCYYFVLNE